MANRKFGSIELEENNSFVLFTGRSGYDTTCNIHLCNRNTTDVLVSVAYINSNSAADIQPHDYIYYNYNLMANHTLDLRGVAVEQNCSIVVSSNSNSVGAIAYGVEEEIS
jgi:hypothetical protein